VTKPQDMEVSSLMASPACAITAVYNRILLYMYHSVQHCGFRRYVCGWMRLSRGISLALQGFSRGFFCSALTSVFLFICHLKRFLNCLGVWAHH